MFMDFADGLFKTLDIATRPVGWVKYSINSLGSLKRELCSFLNNYYQVDTFNPKDYGVRVYVFGGFYIYNKKTGDSIASSSKMNSNYLEIDLEHMKSKEFPEKQLPELSKFYNVKERIYLSYEDSKITQVQNTITLIPHRNENTTMDDEEVYIDICIVKDGNNTVTKVYKELYELSDIHGNRISMDEYPANYHINDFFQAMIIETMITNKEIVEILPELIIPSAYDFNSDDFNGRLLISEMLTC